jgi:hypothetical protein
MNLIRTADSKKMFNSALYCCRKKRGFDMDLTYSIEEIEGRVLA